MVTALICYQLEVASSPTSTPPHPHPHPHPRPSHRHRHTRTPTRVRTNDILYCFFPEMWWCRWKTMTQNDMTQNDMTQNDMTQNDMIQNKLLPKESTLKVILLNFTGERLISTSSLMSFFQFNFMYANFTLRHCQYAIHLWHNTVSILSISYDTVSMLSIYVTTLSVC